MKKIAGLFVLSFMFSCVLHCEDFNSFIKGKTYLPVEYLDALKVEDRNILLKYNPHIENNSEYDFAFERDTKWYENGTFRYMEFSMRMDLFFGNSFFIKICEAQKETFGYIIKGKQTPHSKESFDGAYPCLVDLSPLENLNTDDELKIEIELPVDKLNMSYKDKAGFAKLCTEVVIKDIDCSYVAKETLDILIDFERN